MLHPDFKDQNTLDPAIALYLVSINQAFVDFFNKAVFHYEQFMK